MTAETMPIFYRRLPGCSERCTRWGCNAEAHEAHGFLLGRLSRVTPRVVRTGGLAVDLVARRVAVHGSEVTLGGREWGVLAYLAALAK